MEEPYLETHEEDAARQTHVHRRPSSRRGPHKMLDGKVILLQSKAALVDIRVQMQDGRVAGFELFVERTNGDHGMPHGPLMIRRLKNPAVPKLGSEEARELRCGPGDEEMEASAFSVVFLEMAGRIADQERSRRRWGWLGPPGLSPLYREIAIALAPCARASKAAGLFLAAFHAPYYDS
jgi:hypothetical protein